ncbi:MAG TPA: hypothetical protein VFC02_14065 [Anaerolineales bacterium]|nr:hypothetical protein [Anaerolineales bacterium]
MNCLMQWCSSTATSYLTFVNSFCTVWRQHARKQLGALATVAFTAVEEDEAAWVQH